MIKDDEVKRLVSFFFEIGVLRKVPRAHQQTLLFQDLSDNIASHSFRVTFIGYFLAKELGADVSKVIKMCLLHDLEETRSGDQNWVHKRYLKVFEDEIRQEQLGNLLNSEELLELSREYEQRKTLEAKITKDADNIEQVLLLKEYYWQGSKEAQDWLKLGSGIETEGEKLLFTDLGKQIVKEAKNQNPSDWWNSFWTSKRR